MICQQMNCFILSNDCLYLVKQYHLSNCKVQFLTIDDTLLTMKSTLVVMFVLFIFILKSQEKVLLLIFILFIFIIIYDRLFAIFISFMFVYVFKE